MTQGRRNITFDEGRFGRRGIVEIGRAAAFPLMSMLVASSRIVGLIMVKSLRYCWGGLGEDQSVKNQIYEEEQE